MSVARPRLVAVLAAFAGAVALLATAGAPPRTARAAPPHPRPQRVRRPSSRTTAPSGWPAWLESAADGSLRVPGQGALPARRHPRLGRAARRHAGGGARGGRGARRPRRRQGAGADRRPRQGRRRQARRPTRPTPRRRPATSSGSTSAATSCGRSGSRRPRTSRRSTTSRSRSTGARRSRSSCSRRRAASRSSRSPRRARTRSSACTSTRSRASSRGSARRLVYGAGVEDPSEQKQIAAIIGQLYERLRRFDAMLCEINPLIVTPDGEVKALDSKFTVDDSALFRHPDVAEWRDTSAADPIEAFAREKGVTYVKLDGEVGICGNGAGLSMSTVDVVAHVGGRPANFCDLGGGGSARGRRRRPRGDHARPAGQLDLLQHLRRHHALRRGRARDPRGARSARHVALPDRRPARRHELRGGPRDPRRAPASRTSIPRRRCSTEPAARWSWPRDADVWSERAQAYRDSPIHARRQRPRPDRRLVRAGPRA